MGFFTISQALVSSNNFSQIYCNFSNYECSKSIFYVYILKVLKAISSMLHLILCSIKHKIRDHCPSKL